MPERSQSSVRQLRSPMVRLTDMLLTPQPIQSSLPLPFAEVARLPPTDQSLSTPSNGLTLSVAMYTCVSVSTESMYLILHIQPGISPAELTRPDAVLSVASSERFEQAA